jgi:FG-GAP-like repeat/Secretion system C-terminal sorting domain/FG-GAP repeat
MTRQVLYIIATLFLFPFLCSAEIEGFGPERPIPYLLAGHTTFDQADFNGDGYFDLVVGSYGEDRVYVLRGTSIWSYYTDILMLREAWMRPTVVKSADMDNDGFPDAVAGASQAGEIRWWRSLGDTWQFEQNVVTLDAEGIRDLEVADFDGDGRLDVAAATAGATSLLVCLQESDGVFTQYPIFVDESVFRAVETGDIDGDGDIDLFTASQNIVYYWLNDGSGSQFERHDLAGFAGVRAISICDIDGDGDQDLLGGSENSGVFRVWINTGEMFNELQTQIDCTSISSLSTKDMDEDGDFDVLMALYDSQTIVVYDNLNGMNFNRIVVSNSFNEPLLALPIRADSDSDWDVMAASSNPQRLSTWYLHKTASWEETILLDQDIGVPQFLLGDDFNLDGNHDILFCTASPGRISVLENEGADSYVEHQISDLYVRNAAIADLDLDGLNDFAIASSPIRWYKNNGDFEFDEFITDGTLYGVKAVTAGDMDGDGAADLLAGDEQLYNLYVYFNDGNGSFTRTLVYEFGTSYRSETNVPSDLDGDGDLDILVSTYNEGGPEWLENTGDGHTYLPHEIPGIQYWYHVRSFDYDQDGDMDVTAVKSVDHNNYLILLLLNNGGGQFEIHEVQSLPGVDNTWSADLDQDGDTDLLTVRHDLSWWENVYPDTSYFVQRLISDRWAGSYDVYAGPFDGNASNDVVTMNAGIGGAALSLWHNPIDFPGPTTVTIELFPFDPPIFIPPFGGDVVFDVLLHNTTETVFSGQAWSELLLPTGVIHPLQNVNVSMQPGQTIFRQWQSQFIPAYVQPGTYTFTARIGEYPGNALDEDSFQFVKVSGTTITSVEANDSSTLPDEVALSCNPNPFNTMSTINLAMPNTGQVSIVVYNLLGREVVELFQGELSAGYHHYSFDASGITSGMYFVRADLSDNQVLVQKVMVMK